MQKTKRHGFAPCDGKVSWRKARQPTPVFLPGESMDTGAWQATVHRVAESQTQLIYLVCKHTFSFMMVTIYFSVTGTLSLPLLSIFMKLWVLCGSHCELCPQPSLLPPPHPPTQQCDEASSSPGCDECEERTSPWHASALQLWPSRGWTCKFSSDVLSLCHLQLLAEQSAARLHEDIDNSMH